MQTPALHLEGLGAFYLLAAKHPDTVELMGFHGPPF